MPKRSQKRPLENVTVYTSPIKKVSFNNTQSTKMNFYVIPDVHGNYLTLIKQCMNSIESFQWQGQKELMQTYVDASESSKNNIAGIIASSRSYRTDYVEYVKLNDLTAYNKIEGNDFVEDLKKDLADISIDPADESTEMIFAGDLLADRETNTLHMLYTFKALDDAGVNFKIIYSNHDEMFFGVYGQLKHVFDNLDQTKLKDLEYVKQEFIGPLRKFVSDAINGDMRYTSCYVSLLQFAFSIEKQIYDLHQENGVLQGSEKRSLLSGFEEVKHIVENVYMPHLKMAHFQNLKTSKGSRPHIITHAPQAIMDLKEAHKLTLELLSNPTIANTRRALDIASIYATYQTPYYDEIQYVLSILNLLEKNEHLALKDFIEAKGCTLDPKHSNNPAYINQVAGEIIMNQTKWFVDRIFKLNNLGKAFEKKYEDYQASGYNDSTLKLEITETMRDLSEHFLKTKAQVFENDAMGAVVDPLQCVYLSTFFQLSMNLFTVQNLIVRQEKLTREDYTTLLQALDPLFDNITGMSADSELRYKKYVWSEIERNDFKVLDSILELKKYRSFVKNLSTAQTGWQENTSYQWLLDQVNQYAEESVVTALAKLVEKPEEQRVFLYRYLDKKINNDLYKYKDYIYELSHRILTSKLKTSIPNFVNIPTCEVHSVYGLWKTMVSEAYAKTSNNEIYNNDQKQKIEAMYEKLTKKSDANRESYAECLQNVLLNPSNPSCSKKYLEATEQMINDINDIIVYDPSVLYKLNDDGSKTSLQEKVSAFVWNRHEIMGDQSGHSLLRYIYGHTGNADVDAKDPRITQVSLDNMGSKLGQSRTTFSGHVDDGQTHSFSSPDRRITRIISSPGQS